MNKVVAGGEEVDFECHRVGVSIQPSDAITAIVADKSELVIFDDQIVEFVAGGNFASAGGEFGEHVDTTRSDGDVGGFDFAVDSATEDAGERAAVAVEQNRDATMEGFMASWLEKTDALNKFANVATCMAVTRWQVFAETAIAEADVVFGRLFDRQRRR